MARFWISCTSAKNASTSILTELKGCMAMHKACYINPRPGIYEDPVLFWYRHFGQWLSCTGMLILFLPHQMPIGV